MRIVTESQPVAKPNYVHLAYISAEAPAKFLLSAGIILGIVILIRGALSAWRRRPTKKGESKPAVPDQPSRRDRA